MHYTICAMSNLTFGPGGAATVDIVGREIICKYTPLWILPYLTLSVHTALC